jgi:hypothetical protein
MIDSALIHLMSDFPLTVYMGFCFSLDQGIKNE